MENELEKAITDNTLYDFIANNYYNLSKNMLKDILLECLATRYDERKSEQDYFSFTIEVMNNLKDRGYFDGEN